MVNVVKMMRLVVVANVVKITGLVVVAKVVKMISGCGECGKND